MFDDLIFRISLKKKKFVGIFFFSFSFLGVSLKRRKLNEKRGGLRTLAEETKAIIFMNIMIMMMMKKKKKRKQ